MTCTRAVAAVLTLLAAGTVSGQARVSDERTAARADVMAMSTAGPMLVDGILDEPVWEQAGRITEFLQREPSEGSAPSFATEARVAYDKAALYVAIRAFDPQPDQVAGFLTRRDEW